MPSAIQHFNTKTLSLIKIFLGVILLFAAAQVSIPLKPIPITFHTIAITLIAYMYSPRLAFVTVLTYLIAGIVGFPVFSKFSSGLAYMTGPSFGYFIGFLIATPVMSLTIRALPWNFFSILAGGIIGHIIIFIFGVLWLGTLIGFEKAFYLGFIIFIPTGIVKLGIVSYLITHLGNKKNV